MCPRNGLVAAATAIAYIEVSPDGCVSGGLMGQPTLEALPALARRAALMADALEASARGQGLPVDVSVPLSAA